MRKIYLLFAFVLILLGCQKDEINSYSLTEKKESHQLQEIAFNDLPGSISQYFKKQNFIKSSIGGDKGFFGNININIPARKIISKEGDISYTLALHNKGANQILYFDNLVIYKNKNNPDEIYVIRYIPKKL